MHRKPRYATNVEKAQEVILWLAERMPSVDVYHLVKAAYYADKHHIARYGRPIMGDVYRAAPWGPLPQVIYGLLNHRPIDLLALGSNGDVQFKVLKDYPFTVSVSREANLRKLSDSDIQALEFGATQVEHKSFDEIYEETHSDPAYVRAEGGVIDYRDMIPEDDPQRKKKQEYIGRNAQDTAL